MRCRRSATCFTHIGIFDATQSRTAFSSVGGKPPFVSSVQKRPLGAKQGFPPSVPRITPSALVMVVIAIINRDHRVIVAVVEVFGCRRLIVVAVAVSSTHKTARFCLWRSFFRHPGPRRPANKVVSYKARIWTFRPPNGPTALKRAMLEKRSSLCFSLRASASSAVARAASPLRA